jgi:glycosyltransferase involved in cell wall biosynthesis
VPKVSVIIPTRNRAEFLRQAITSALKQTLQNLEIIVVDDASEDYTGHVIQSFTDPRIRYIRHDTCRGQGATRNAGLHLASGEYVALLDDDDQWMPQKLERQVALLDESPSKVAMVYTGICRIDVSTKRIVNWVIPDKRGSLFEDICKQNFIGGCSSVMFRRSCLDKIGCFDEELASAADYDMWLRISKEFDIEYIREALVVYAVHPNRISTNYESKVRGLEAVLKKHRRYLALDSQNQSRRYFLLGINYCLNGNVKKGRGALLKAIGLYPFAVKSYYYLCLSLVGADTVKRWKQLRDNFPLRRIFLLRWSPWRNS